MSAETNEFHTDQDAQYEHEEPSDYAETETDAEAEPEVGAFPIHATTPADPETATGAASQTFPNPYVTSAPYVPEDDATEPEVETEPDGVPLPENLGGRNTGFGSEPLVDAEEFLSRWTGIQMSFVEDPSAAVEDADTLVREITAALVAALEQRSDSLASEARAATDTEQQRLALRQYRAYLGTLLPH